MASSEKSSLETATFAAGCFWGVEEAFRNVKGVRETAAGFVGGKTKNPSYTLVCTGLTGHAEAVQVKFNPKEVSYEKLLDVFWSIHNPTTLNRQGVDIGTQYRSVIFFHTKEQEEAAKKSKQELEKSGKSRNKIVTQIVPATEFFKAEEYHQKYYLKRGMAGKVC